MNHDPYDDVAGATDQTARLWLQALQQLDPHNDDLSWYPSSLDLARSLLAAAEEGDAFLELVNQALVLQQFLLEVACRPTRTCDRAAIVRQATRLLDQPELVPA